MVYATKNQLSREPLAPIALFVYNRPEHTQATLEALAANELAQYSDLIVFSDGPKSAADEPAVIEVRESLKKLDGFKSVRIVASDANKGLATSIISGVSEVVGEYGRIIVLEDDLVTNPATLGYFNLALQHFENFPSVFSVSGYNHPKHIMPIPENYTLDVYAIPRMQCWGWATWEDRWKHADFSVPDFDEFLNSPRSVAAYEEKIGKDSLNTLKACMRGEKDVWACRWVYTHFKHRAVCICPTVSLIDNIGLDGSGSNCGVAEELRQEVSKAIYEGWRLPQNIQVEREIFESFMSAMGNPQPAPTAPQGLPPAGASMDNTRMSSPGLIERAIYWSVRPVQLKNRLVEKFGGRAIATHAAGSVEAIDVASPTPSDAVTVQPANRPLVRLGTVYGGWHVPEQWLTPEHTIVSAGAGEDLSFDVAVASKFKSRIVILDPTPRAREHFEMLSHALQTDNAAPINNSDSEFYEADSSVLSRLEFLPLGMWDREETLTFFAPANPKHVSHSIGNLHNSEAAFEAECVSLPALMKTANIDKIDVLKLDIEGAEFQVLEHLLTTDIRPSYILVEFHPGKDEEEASNRPRTNALIRKLGDSGYRLVENSGWDYVLELS